MRFLAQCIGFAAGLTMAAALLSTTQAVAASEKTEKHKAAPPFDRSLYVGSETCKTCHEDIYKNFEATPHWKTTLLHREGAQGCEGCHGPGKAHVEGGGDKSKIFVFEGAEPADVSKRCVERCEQVTAAMLRVVFRALAGQRVHLEQMLLKPNMVTAGKDCPQQSSISQVAEATLRCLRRTVPPAVPGIVFLSGGQEDVLATQHLNAMNQMRNAPWQLSFSYGRALQSAALKSWHRENVPAGQRALQHRALCNSAARQGTYSEDLL